MSRSRAHRAGWTTVSFGDVVRLSKERSSDPESKGFERFIGLEHIDPGDLCIRRWGEVAAGTTFMNVFRQSQVLFGKRRAYQRKVALATFDGVCSGDIYVLEPRGEQLLPALLAFICQTEAFLTYAIGTSAGSLSPRTNWANLSSFEFALPPLDEQRSICTGLVAASNLVSSLRSLVASTSQARRSISTHLFARMVQDDRTTTTRLGDSLESIVDRGHQGLPILSVTIDGAVVRRESLERHVSDDTGDEKYLRVARGDIAYNTMRLWQGAVGVAKEVGLVSSAYTVLRPRNGTLPGVLFWEMLRSPALRQRYRQLVTGVASDRWRLYYKDLSQIRLRLPDSQQAAAILRQLDAAREAEEAAGARAHDAERLLDTMRKQRLGS